MNQAQIKELRRIIRMLETIDEQMIDVDDNLTLTDGIEDLEALLHQVEAPMRYSRCLRG